MKICIPTLDEGGLAARVSPHFGSAPYLTFVDLKAGGVDVVRREEHSHGQGCGSLDLIGSRGATALLCQGLGKGAYANLSQGGVEVFLTDSSTVEGAVEAFRAGRIGSLEENDVCGGHGHGSGCH